MGNILTSIGARLVASLATKHMLIWALRLIASRTDNKLDNAAVDLLEAGLNNDGKAMQESAKRIGEQALQYLDR